VGLEDGSRLLQPSYSSVDAGLTLMLSDSTGTVIAMGYTSIVASAYEKYELYSRRSHKLKTLDFDCVLCCVQTFRSSSRRRFCI